MPLEDLLGGDLLRRATNRLEKMEGQDGNENYTLAGCRREPQNGSRNSQNELILTKKCYKMNISKPNS
jgi:hypothetical protein